MNRREFLVGTTASLLSAAAGCVGLPGGSQAGPNSTMDPTTPNITITTESSPTATKTPVSTAENDTEIRRGTTPTDPTENCSGPVHSPDEPGSFEFTVWLSNETDVTHEIYFSITLKQKQRCHYGDGWTCSRPERHTTIVERKFPLGSQNSLTVSTKAKKTKDIDEYGVVVVVDDKSRGVTGIERGAQDLADRDFIVCHGVEEKINVRITDKTTFSPE